MGKLVEVGEAGLQRVRCAQRKPGDRAGSRSASVRYRPSILGMRSCVTISPKVGETVMTTGREGSGGVRGGAGARAPGFNTELFSMTTIIGRAFPAAIRLSMMLSMRPCVTHPRSSSPPPSCKYSTGYRVFRFVS